MIFKAIIFLIVLIVAGCGSGSEYIKYQGAYKVAEPTSGIYHSIFPNIDFKNETEQKYYINEYIDIAGAKPVIIHFSNHWFDGIEFPEDEAKLVAKMGFIPCIRMLPWSAFNIGKKDPVYSLKKIINGNFDEELIEYANDVKKSNIVMIIEFAVEMNGNWFPWSGVFNGKEKGPGVYKKAYRHIIDLFKKQGVKNVTWAFHINYNSTPSDEWNKPINYYPGDEYIDWIGFSVYGAQKPTDHWYDWYSLINPVYKDICEISASKPIAIFEFGVTETKNNWEKSGWVRDAFASIIHGNFPRVKMISWWHSDFQNSDGSMTYMRIDSSPEALNEYQYGIRNEIFKAPINLK